MQKILNNTKIVNTVLRPLKTKKCPPYFLRHGSHFWSPDPEYIKQFKGPVMYPDKITSKWKNKTWSGIGKIKGDEMTIKNMVINFGCAHPAAHGLLRLVLELDGEIVRKLTPHIGFLHRGTEKNMEYRTYLQNVHYFDRLDYASPMCNEHAFCLAVEKLLNVEVPPRAKYIRTLMCELTRLLNHMLNTAGVLLDCGAITPLFWFFEEREKIFEFYERCSGARMHTGYFRPGGVLRDIPIGFLDDVNDFLQRIGVRLDEVEDVATENRLFIQRTKDIAILSSEDALNLGCSGVMLRASGVKWDIRKAKPYDAYADMDFDVVVGANGDIYDRFLVKMGEMRQSMRIIEQCINCMPKGETSVDDQKITPPPRAKMKAGMEELIHHFLLYSKGFSVPPGSTYVGVEQPKGEFGVYLVSDGTSKPYRCKIRAPSFIHLSTIHHICKNLFLADVVAMIASLDIVFGDIDR